MEVLSVNENKTISKEADILCLISEKYKDEICRIECGDKMLIEGKSFICVSSDKNIVIRVEGYFEWYLKFSLKEEWVRHEIIGAKAARTQLANFDGYNHPKSIRASINHRYTLYSASEGKCFNRLLLRSCAIRRSKISKTTSSGMENLGATIGLLHSYESPSDMQSISPTIISYLEKYLKHIKEDNLILDRINKHVLSTNLKRQHQTWIHGNIKSEDIFFSGSKVSIIDFGTFGKGSPYEDLTNLCTYLILFRTVPTFPWKTPRIAMNSLLNGYLLRRNIDREELLAYVRLGIFRYYLKNSVMHKGIPTLSGMPVSKKRLEKLVFQLLDGNYRSAFERIDF